MQPELIGGRYRVESAIGRGGMGTVWLCLDETLHRHVAVKQVGLLPGESVTDSARAFREARASAGLSHRNVVTVFDVVEEAGHIWLVMEHVPGRSLSQIIKQDGPLDPGVVAAIGADVADGLSALHAGGTMHRDVKPGNVLLREDGVAKISDFGIARTAGDATLTQAGYLTGTPSYFSPALARGVEPTQADDVWALGATLYAAVEGHPPYARRDNPMQVLHEITTGPPLAPERADFLEPALKRMLDRDPESRWSMEDAGHTLRRLAEAHRPDATLAQTRAGTTDFPPVAAATPVRSGAREDTPRPVPSPSIEYAEESPSTRLVVPPSRRGGARRRTRTGVIALIALLLCGGIVFAATHLGSDANPPSANDAKPTKKSAKGSSSNEKSKNSSSSSTSSSSGTKEAFIRDYYAKAPGGSDEAWEMLAPAMQTMGRERYFGFWRTIESVDVRDVQPGSDPNTVEVTLVYRTTDGKTSTERKREVLSAVNGGGYQIESDVSAG